MLAEHDDFALGEAPVTDVDIDGLTGEPVELHHGPAAESENVLHGHGRSAELDGHRQR